MKRYDLRQYKNDFINRMNEIIKDELSDGEVGIFIFEIGGDGSDGSIVNMANDSIKSLGFQLLNSIRFNEVDWSIVIKKEKMQDSKEETL
ncbi:NADH-ubiquinone oxidoreductase subunit E family protein [Helicobacter sp. MIT 99-5507]|uniref:NADH-ubiquinone oxidoreductase subunit E family protein n=1 Tax=Helicobacter sp. MIT 99-5507 TaxID=152489 RepID=UPI000E1E7618|nr:NADH-ubiquinone oxidoreductase subunit E family protein [Helicobacter sp. MIT 99-5507]RDU57386.1 NADH oxidoreductase [Helicobacter sp. MIT 99-5507]